MPRVKELVTTPSDDKTRQYVLDMMKDLPGELFALVTELRDTSAVIKLRANTLDRSTQAAYEQFRTDMNGLTARIDMLLQVIQELCRLAQKGTAIEPMWNIMQEKQVDPLEKDK